jgi:uncharacterized membrane protein YfcA
VIGVVFGYVFGITSVGAGAFFGIALILLFPLSAHRVVGTDLYHGALVTIPAAIASYFLLPDVHLETVAYLMCGSIPGILIGAQVMVSIPERALRSSLATVLAFSGLNLFGLFEEPRARELSFRRTPLAFPTKSLRLVEQVDNSHRHGGTGRWTSTPE